MKIKLKNKPSKIRFTSFNLFLILYFMISCNSQTSKEDHKKACDNGDGRSCYIHARALHDEDKIKDAEKLYHFACSKDGQEACVREGIIKYNNGKQKEGIKIQKKACKAGPNGAEGCFNLGLIEEEAGDFEKAKAFHLKACKEPTFGKEGCTSYGVILYNEGKKEKGMEYLKKACDHEDFGGCYIYGKVLIKNNKKKIGADFVKKACEKSIEAACDYLAEVEGRAPHKACHCNFGGCLGPRSVNCVQVVKCQKVTAEVYSDHVNNRKALLVLGNNKFCHNPTLGFLRGN